MSIPTEIATAVVTLTLFLWLIIAIDVWREFRVGVVATAGISLLMSVLLAAAIALMVFLTGTAFGWVYDMLDPWFGGSA